MSHLTSQRGFAIVEVLAVLVVVTIIGVVGVRVWQAQHPIASEQNKTVATQAAPIETVADLEKTDAEIEQLDVEGTTLTELDAQLDY